jgi:hypothetical protein
MIHKQGMAEPGNWQWRRHFLAIDERLSGADVAAVSSLVLNRSKPHELSVVS